MKCTSCGSEVVKIITFENGITQCRECPKKYVPKPMVGLFIKHASGINERSRRTAAHDQDISRRRLGSDGKTVVRDYKKKVFAMP